jgi:ribonuclease VapC
MFLDASVIVAICSDEKDAGYFIAKIEMASNPIFYSSLSMFEAVIALARKKTISIHGDNVSTPPEVIDQVQAQVEAFMEAIGAKELSITGTLHKKAIEVARTYGRFVGHPAKLNFGDCFAYACARSYRLSLLFKGDDFSKTDIELA